MRCVDVVCLSRLRLFMISDLYAQKLVFNWCLRASEIHRALKPLATGVSYCGEGARRDRWEVGGGES
ncbi:MAG: hypothetical protein LM561_00600 [Desulfurococcaceae archaeon]|nr:hypothetical protein [Desulfurococcaceae archaeon]